MVGTFPDTLLTPFSFAIFSVDMEWDICCVYQVRSDVQLRGRPRNTYTKKSYEKIANTIVLILDRRGNIQSSWMREYFTSRKRNFTRTSNSLPSQLCLKYPL